MHIPDGFIDAPVSIAAMAISVPSVAWAIRRAGRQLVEREIPVAGLVTAYLVVAQLLVFPIGFGTSAHLVGAGLALVLVGPSIAITCVSVVVVLQALVFADGGVSALGLNALNSGLVPILAAWLVVSLARRSVRRRPGRLPLVAGVAAGLGALAGAVAFCIEYAIGATGSLPAYQVAAGMLVGHAVIAPVEGVLTGLLVAAIVRTRPDLLRRRLGPVEGTGEGRELVGSGQRPHADDAGKRP